MTIVPIDFQNRLRALLELHGGVFSEGELSHVAEWYPRCRGKEQWDVRQYARSTGEGAREYRVVRGSGVHDVFCSPELARASAVRAALNELEMENPELA